MLAGKESRTLSGEVMNRKSTRWWEGGRKEKEGYYLIS